MPEAIRILITEDHAVVRDGLASVLEFERDMKVIAHARNGREAIERFREFRPDVTLMDLAMPEVDGVQAISAIRGEFPEARILVLTTYDGDENVFRALEAGAKGYLLKDCSTADLLTAVRKIHAGGTHVSERAAAQLAERTMKGAVLSPRELEVLKLIAGGRSNKEIASLLFISEGTVKTHVISIHEKLGVSGRTESVVAAIKRGILRI
ncbi:MAG TPA: response regulator transcription factor [Terriglobia bacterium]|jgi:DNA-binding NarL/FixJ family response regulator